MKKILQKSLCRLHALLLLAVLCIGGGNSAWAETVTFQMSSFAWDYPNGYTSVSNGITATFTGGASMNDTQFELWNYGSAALKLSADAANITRVEMECVAWNSSTTGNEYAVAVCEWDGINYNYEGANYTPMSTDGTNAIWSGTPTTLLWLTSSDDIDVRKLTVYYESLPDIEYHINITNEGTLPSDFTPSVTLDGESFSSNGTHRTPKTLTTSSVSSNAPEDWYYDVDYVESTHTFTVTYKEYLHYIVDVTGCEEETAGVRVAGDYQTYKDNSKINVKEELAVSDLTVVEVNGYIAGIPAVSELDGHNGTVTVPYSEAGLKNYTVTISGMPSGTSVKVEDESFTENGTFTHESRKTLNSSDATVLNCPETHYTNESYQWYDEDTQTYTIAFNPYLVYTVAVDETSAYKGADAGVKVFNAYTYLPGQPIYNKTALTESDVKATDVEGYTGTVTLDGNVFTVSYTKNNFIIFNANTDPYYNGVNYNVTKEDVTLTAWEYGTSFRVNSDGYYPLTLTSNGAPIVKVELQYAWTGGDVVDGCNVGSFNSDMNVWTGSTNSLHIWDTRDWGIEVSSIKVYLAQPNEYHVNIAGMPAGDDTYVVINNDYDHGKYTTSGNYTYSTFTELNEWSVNLFYPESYKASKTYDAETKTYNVTYTALTQYNVVADAENEYTEDGSGIRVKIGEGEWDYNNYSLGSTFYFDGTLEESAITVRSVDGYNGTFVLDNEADPKTITVKYTEKPAVTYTVEFAGVVPEGASVTISDAEGSRTISNEDAVKTFQSKYNVTEASAKAKQFEYYDATIALDGTTFTVTYSNVDYILVDLTNAEGQGLTRKSAGETITVEFDAYSGCANLYSGSLIVVTSNTYNIKKIEYVLAEHYSDVTKAGASFNWGAWTTDYEVWEPTEDKTKSVELSTTYSDICYTAVKVYLDTDPVGEFAMSAAGWATLCVNDDFILPEDYTAYTVGKLVGNTPVLEEDGQIVFTEIERVPAGTPVIISGPENANVSLLPTYGAIAPEVNYLYGNNSDVAMTYYANQIADQGLGELDTNTWEYTYGAFGPCQLYQLAKEDGYVGFYRQIEDGVSLKCGAHKAFLVVPSNVAASNARFLFPGQEGTLTSIEGVATEGAEAIYNLQGQRVNAAKAGVYVKNGKKFIVK